MDRMSMSRERENLLSFAASNMGPAGRGASENPLDGLNLLSLSPGAMGVVDPSLAKAGDVESQKKIVDAIMETHQHEKSVRNPHDSIWDRVWERVNNRWDFSRKQKWQSQRGLPEMLTSALRLTWEITKPLEEAGSNWFRIESDDSTYGILAEDVSLLLKSYLHPGDDSGYEEEAGDFHTAFYSTVMGGLIMENCCLLVVPEEDGYADMQPSPEAAPTEEGGSPADVPLIPQFGFGSMNPAPPPEPMPVLQEKRGFRLRFEAFNPRYVWKDSTGRKRYVQWTQTMTADEFRLEAEQRGWMNVEEAIQSAAPVQERLRDESRDKNQGSGEGRRDTIILTHHLGMLFDTNGRFVVDKEQNYYILANEEILVWGPDPNPLWHRRIPMVIAGLVKLPFTTYNTSFLGIALDPIEQFVETMNSATDYMQQALNPPTVIDEEQLSPRRGNQFAGGIFPGKMIYAEKGGKAFPVVSREATPDPGSGVWNMIGLYEKYKTAYVGIGDTGSAPRTRNRISAQEFSERQAMSAGILRQVFKNLRRGLLQPALRLAYLTVLQKCPDAKWKEFWESRLAILQKGGDQAAPQGDNPMVSLYQQVMNWTPAERFTKLGKAFSFSVQVYDAIENKREKLEKLNMLATGAQSVPVLGSRIKWHKVAEDWCEALDLDRSQYLWPNAGNTAESPISPELAVQAAFAQGVEGPVPGAVPGPTNGLPTAPPGAPPTR